MEKNYMEGYNFWLSDSYFDLETKKELEKIKGNEKEIEDRFFKDLDFGTGGLRGVIGAGTNRMNIYTVRKATQGLANYIIKEKSKEKDNSVCIAYDSRRFSKEFATEAALVLNGNGIKTYLFESLRPTPELSFAIRETNSTSGIVVTASHNPPEYNGYKVYWDDGGQVPFPRDEAIITEVNEVTDFKLIKLMDKDEAEKKGLFEIIGKEIDDKFISKVKEQLLNKELVKEYGEKLNIVYTPLHGTGNIPVRRVLSEVGFKNVYVVKEQELPDPDFTTVGYPNPEDPKAFTYALKLADEVNADVVLATDPDCDRVGAAVKDKTGKYIILTGNNTGVLIADYILKTKKKLNELPNNGAIISTIVSTDMTKEICRQNNVSYFEVLTGFKFIGEKIKEFEITGSNTFLFGFEESYGCLAGTYARDKDAVVASMLICEIAAYYKSLNMNLFEALENLYKEYGFYMESIESISLKGIEGLETIKKIMEGMRKNPPKQIGNINVLEYKDYKLKKDINYKTSEEKETTLPVSDVLYFTLEDESFVCVRPSGTEPKIKIYFGVKGNSESDGNNRLKKLISSSMDKVNEYK